MSETTPKHCAAEIMETMPPVMQFIRTEMRHQGASFLSVPQFRALRYFGQYPGASLSELAEHLGVTRATASSIVERLVRRELLDRVADPQERRRNVHTLTPTGSEHLRQAREHTRDQLAEVLATLSETKLTQIATGFALVREALQGVAKTEG